MATGNPYASPTATATVAPHTDRERLRRIATAQRLTNLAVLFYLCLIPANIALSTVVDRAPWAAVVFAAVAISVLIFGAISVYGLAAQFRGKAVAVIYVLGLLVPLLGLILLVTISSKATTILKENGIKVGLLGANPTAI